MHITEFLGISKGHAGISFVDIATEPDTPLFIDPCLIELASDPLSQQAAALIADFTSKLYADIRSGRWNSTSVFNETHEINDTSLGYGNGRNGTGNTADGMRVCLNELRLLANGIRTINRIQDISVLVRDFAEDGMSDLLTNLLRALLSQFTAEQMEKYGKLPNDNHRIKAWDIQQHDWVVSEHPYWLVDGKKVLLVPKHWVRQRYLFRASQYLSLAILARMQNEARYKGLTKEELRNTLKRDNDHWMYDRVIQYTRENPEVLEDYHQIMPTRYALKHGRMSDDDLDDVVYAHRKYHRR